MMNGIHQSTCQNKENKQFKFMIIEEEPEIVPEHEWQDAVEEVEGTISTL